MNGNIYDISVNVLGAFITHYLYILKDEQGVFLKIGHKGKSTNRCLLKIKVYRYSGEVLPRLKTTFLKSERVLCKL